MSDDDVTRERFAATADRLAALADKRVEGLRSTLRELLELTGDEIALDAGTGTGPVAFALAPLVREVIAVDLVEAMLEQGRARNAAYPNVRFQLGDALALPVEDASVDLAASARTLHHLPDAAAAIAELARVVRPGGRVVVVDQLVSEDAGEAADYERIEKLRDSSHVRTLPDSELRALHERNGLEIERVEIEPEPRELGVFLDLAGCEGEAREAVFAYAGELVDAGRDGGVGLRRDGDTFRFSGRVGWYVSRRRAT